MCWKKQLFLIVFLCFVMACNGSETNEIEARGKKKKKIALFIYFADLILKKIFIFKLVYAFIFWLVIHKAGYFLGWFVSYLKEQKKSDHDYHHAPHYYEYGPHSPYRKESHGIK